MEDVELVERLVRIESSLDGVRQAIEAGDRNSAQMVTLVNQEVTHVKADITNVANASRELEKRVMSLERFTIRLIAFGGGISVATGGTFAAVFKALGGH